MEKSSGFMLTRVIRRYFNCYEASGEFIVMKLNSYQAILGMSWFITENLIIDWYNGKGLSESKSNVQNYHLFNRRRILCQKPKSVISLMTMVRQQNKPFNY